MATTRIEDPPLLGTLLDSIVRRLPYEVVWSIVEAPEPDVQADDPIGEMLRLLRIKCRKRLDEPEYNAETRRAIEEGREGVGVTRHASMEDLFADLKN